jgi:hypothetical protein
MTVGAFLIIKNDEKPQRHKGHFGFAVTERSRSAVEPQSFFIMVNQPDMILLVIFR